MKARTARKSPSGRTLATRAVKRRAPKRNRKPNDKHSAHMLKLTPTWKAIFSVLGKAETMTRSELTAVCEAHHAKGWFGRFLEAGLLTRPDHGVYKLTAAGRRALK